MNNPANTTQATPHAWIQTMPVTGSRELSHLIIEAMGGDFRFFLCGWTGCAHPVGFLQKAGLVAHIRFEHLKEKPFQCTFWYKLDYISLSTCQLCEQGGKVPMHVLVRLDIPSPQALSDWFSIVCEVFLGWTIDINMKLDAEAGLSRPAGSRKRLLSHRYYLQKKFCAYAFKLVHFL